MYDITIQVQSEQDLRPIMDQIAALIERATGQQCRVSIHNFGPQRKMLAGKTQAIVEKLNKKTDGQLT